MKISFRQSGGLLGHVRECDTESLDATVVTQARNLLLQSGVTSSVKLVSAAARDAKVYTVTVTEDHRGYEITVDDASLPENLEPLIELLARHSKPAG